MSSVREELERLQEEVVRLQARVDELETEAAARAEQQPRRGLGSLIPGGSAQVG